MVILFFSFACLALYNSLCRPRNKPADLKRGSGSVYPQPDSARPRLAVQNNPCRPSPGIFAFFCINHMAGKLSLPRPFKKVCLFFQNNIFLLAIVAAKPKSTASSAAQAVLLVFAKAAVLSHNKKLAPAEQGTSFFVSVYDFFRRCPYPSRFIPRRPESPLPYPHPPRNPRRLCGSRTSGRNRPNSRPHPRARPGFRP